MRAIQCRCILVASFVILSATNAESSKHKRDLSLVKNFIKLAVFGHENKTESPPVVIKNDENVKIFRIPGFNNILVKAVPKVDGVAAGLEKVDLVLPISEEDQRKVGIVSSYLGTQTQAETLKALQGVKTLLGSGILTAAKDLEGAVPIGPLGPYVQAIAIGEATVEKPHVLLDTPSICDHHYVDERPVVIQQQSFWQGHPWLPIFEKPIQVPSIIKPVLSPVKVPVPVLPTKYSYKQIHKDGKVTTYAANDDHNVIVTETDQPVPLPPFVTYRIQEIMKLGAHRVQGMATIPVFAGHIQKPIVHNFHSEKINPYGPVGSGSNYLYKQIHNDGTATSYSSNHNGANVVVSETGKVPTIPGFIAERIENLAATAFTEIQPNVGVLLGTNVVPTIDIRGGERIKVDAIKQPQTPQPMNLGSQSMYSYQTVHNDGTITNHHHGIEGTVYKKPLINTVVKPISPAFIEDRLETIVKENGGSFSYKILHRDGSVTNYGVFGVHEGINGGNKIVPVKTDIYQTNQPQIKKENVVGSFTHKIIHNDGSISSYSNTGVVEQKGKGSVNLIRERGNKGIAQDNINQHLYLNTNQNTGLLSHGTTNKVASTVSAVNHHASSDSKTHNPSQGSFSYKAVHSDGSMTVYSQNGVEEISDQQKVTVNTKQNSNQNYQVNVPNNVDIISNKPVLSIQVNSKNNVEPASSFSYKAVHNDGSITTYSQNGVTDQNNKIKNEDKIQQSLKAIKANQNQDKVKVSPGSFSYKTIHNDESTTYYSGQGVEEIKLPNDIAVSAPAQTDRTTATHSHNGIKKVATDTEQLQDKYTESSGSFSYKTVHSDGSVTEYSGKDVEDKKPSSSFSYKTIQSDGSLTHDIKSVSLQQNIKSPDVSSVAFVNSKPKYEQPIELIPPAAELSEISNKLADSSASVLVGDSNQVLFTKPLVSSYTYKQINHNLPNQFTVAVNIDEAGTKESQLKVSSQVAASHINGAAIVDTIPKDYVYIPPATHETPPFKPAVPKEEINVATYNPPSAVVLAPVEVTPCAEKSLSEHPIVVLDEPMQYSYQHRKVDGSAMLVESDQSVVSVNISPKKEKIPQSKNRGDIP